MSEQGGGEIPPRSEERAVSPTEASKGWLKKAGEQGSAGLAALWGTNAGLQAGLALDSINQGRSGLMHGIAAGLSGITSILYIVADRHRNPNN